MVLKVATSHLPTHLKPDFIESENPIVAHLTLLRGAMGAGKTTVSKKLRELSSGTIVIEIDDIKTENNGNTGKCDPKVDFREAGIRARSAMDAGHDAVVVEPLCTREHIGFVLASAGLQFSSSEVTYIWLDCSLETAIERKENGCKREVIEAQHRRYGSRERPAGELVIDTNSRTVESIATLVVEFISRRRQLNSELRRSGIVT